MGLPSKKQLHKHKRGTRKALDTLDAMDKVDSKTIDDEGVENLVEKKKSKKSSGKAKKKTAKSREKAVEPDLQEKESKIELDPAETTGSIVEDQKDEIVDETSEQEPEAAEKKKLDSASNEDLIPEENEDKTKPDKKMINLDGLEEESFLEEKKEAEQQSLESEDVVPAAQETIEDENKELADQPATEAPSSSELTIGEDYEEAFEDTQKDKYLTFKIGEESFGFSIKYITEIIVIHKITEVPDTPAFVRGVINLRGKVIPVIDVRHRFNMELRDYDDRTCIIVVEYEETAVGLIVDTVNEVADIPENQIDPPPRTHSGIESSYIMGMGKIGKEVNILLNLEKVLFVDEILAKRRILEEGT